MNLQKNNINIDFYVHNQNYGIKKMNKIKKKLNMMML